MSADATDWRAAIGKIAVRIGHKDYPTGNLAALRRLRPEAPDGAAFWWLAAEYAPSAFDDDRACVALGGVVQGMAIAHPFHQPLGGRRPLGEALAEAEVSEARLMRLLRLSHSELPEELRRLARLMSSKGDAGRFDWSDAFALLYWAGGETGERDRRKIARDYYRKQYNLQKVEESAA